MRATIEHESRGRMRLRLRQKNMTLRQADLLETWLKGQPWAKDAVVHERTCCAILTYAGDRATVLSAIGSFTWAGAEEAVTLPSHSTRELNREFQEKLVGKVLMKGAAALFLPAPLRIARVVWHMVPFLRKGLRCLGGRKIKVELLDALSIGISVCRRDFGTAGTVMFLLEIGELLEDWTRKKSVADLAESLSLHVDRVWLKTEAGEVLTPIGQISPGDRVVIRAGGVIPLDGVGGGRRCHRQPGLPHRRVRPRGQTPRRHGVRRYRGRGGRVCSGGETGLRPGPLRPDRGDDPAVRADEVWR